MKEGLITILKFFFFLLILPLVIASALAFQNSILSVPASEEKWLLWGVVAFVLSHLFLYEFKEVYTFGQSIVAGLLKFLGGAANLAGLIIPIYTILLIAVYLMLHVFEPSRQYEGFMLMAIGFSVAMHIVLTAHQLCEADSSPIKAHYFFAFGAALVVNLIIVSLLLSLAVADYSFLSFFKHLSSHATAYYQAIFKSLFGSLS